MKTTNLISGEKLAIDGGPQAFARQHGRRRPKIGIDEFMSIAERFGFSDESLGRIHFAISDDDLGEGPTLSRFLTAHPPQSKGEDFEQAAREIFGSKYALPTSSGTGALHSAMVAVGVGPGSEVIVPAIGFFATAATVVAAKGVPVFCDADESLCIDPKKIEALNALPMTPKPRRSSQPLGPFGLPAITSLPGAGKPPVLNSFLSFS